MSEAGPTEPLTFERLTPTEMLRRAEELRDRLRARRSVRDFSSEPIDLDVVRACIDAAASAPSGANKQPWTFVLVTDPAVKRAIREAAEKEEQTFYGGRAPERWLADLRPLGTDWRKPFLEDAPALIVVFAQRHGGDEGDKHYYVSESVGIAVGMLITALHVSGLATLTHTPSPMGFLASVLGRPDNERAYVLLPVGYPADGATVPAITKKPLDAVLVER
ncbi:MAG: nitroreductase family protein [Myxococcales bacterium]|nr:nitroreductase family protein [Myxococcales bacterium]